jgi:type IV pilus assembly protein PilQ
VTFSFEDEEIKNVIRAIAKAANADVVIAPDVKGLVNMELQDVPWRDALDTVVKTLNYHIVEEDRGILRVVSSDNLSVQLEERVFELKYMRPRSTYVAKIQTSYAYSTDPNLKNGGQQGGGAGGANQNDPRAVARREFPLLVALEKMLSKDGVLDYYDRENVIFVKDIKPVLDKIQATLERLDNEPVQIYVDVKFVTTANSDTSDLAFGFENGFQATLNGAQRTSRLPFNLGPGSIGDNLLPGRSDDNVGENDIVDGIRLNNLTSNVTPGLLDFSATSLAIRLVKSDLNAEIVQAPKIITLDHQEATIFVGETIRYAEADSQSNQAGGLQLVVREAQGSPVQTGFQLMVIPHVVPGSNRIMMTVIPQAETLTGTTDPNLPGFDLFTVGAGTQAGLGQISLPRIGSQTIVTNMMLESGQTGVIGGLITDNVRTRVTKVPFLGDIPVLGWLFKREENLVDKRGLLVFLTPYIIRGADRAEDELKEQVKQIEQRAEAEWQRLGESPEGSVLQPPK